MSFPFGEVLSGAAVVAAVISPVITSIVNNNHQIKLRKIDFEMNRRGMAIDGYIRSASELIKIQTYREEPEYARHMTEIYLYISPKLWHYIDTIDKHLQSEDYCKAQSTLTLFCKELSKEFPRSVK